MFFNFSNAKNEQAVNSNLVKSINKGVHPHNEQVPIIHIRFTDDTYTHIAYRNEDLRNIDFYNFISKNT